MFERQYLEGKAPLDVEYVCGGFAEWLSSAWEYLDGEEKVLLMSVGSALWRVLIRAGAPRILVRWAGPRTARVALVDQYNC